MTYKLQDLRRENSILPGQLDRSNAKPQPAFSPEAFRALQAQFDEIEKMSAVRVGLGTVVVGSQFEADD